MVNTRAALALVVAMVATTYADPAAPPAIDDAIKNAATAKKPLIVMFSATWCGPCKVFEHDVLPAAEVQTALGEVVFVHYDAEASPGLEAAARFRVDAYPTFIVIDRHGVEMKRKMGGLDVAAFVDLVTDAKHSVTDEADMRAELKTHPNDPAVRLRAARWFAAHQMKAAALPHYAAVAKDKTATQKERDEATAARDHLQRIELWHQDLVADKVALIRSNPATVALDDLAIALIDSNLPPKEVRELASLALAASTDVARTNTMIYVALTAGANDEALIAAKKLVELSRQAEFLDTLAECFHVTGDRAQALQTEDDALNLATGPTPLEAMIKRNRARFDTGTGESDDVMQLRLRIADLSTRLEGADQLVARVAPRTASRYQPQMIAWRKAYEAEQTLAKTTAAACAKEAGRSAFAIARVEIDPTGHITSSTVLVEETARSKLRACITHALATATLPVLPGQTKRQLSFEFKQP